MSGTAYWLYPILPFRIVASTIFPILEIAVYSSHRICHEGNHLKGLYSPQDLYFRLTTLLAHPRWDLPVKCFTPMVSENKNTLKRMKSSLLGYYSSRYLLFILYLTVCFWICCIKSRASIWEKWHHCQRAKTWRIISITAKKIRRMLITRLICIQWKFTTLDQLASPRKFGSLRFFSTTEAFTCSKAQCFQVIEFLHECSPLPKKMW